MKERDEILNDVLHLVKKHNVTAYELGNNTGIAISGVTKILDRRTKKPQLYTLETIRDYILNKYENSDKNYGNENDTSVTKEQDISFQYVTNDLENKIPKDGLKIGIPYYNVDFAGGWSSDEMFVNVRPDFYINNPEFDRSNFACNLIGKSVSKIIPDGAVVGFKVIDDWQTYFPQNELYGIITKNDFRTVKLIGKTKDGKSLILKPEPSEEFSDRYKDQEEIIPIEFITKFLQVIAYACYERIAM
ncbi:hypothetical protein [Soonwooa sp.]|uniref:hypothetical protein n=1 Tax=Soonwooa sp. TaxID=1938592 RepID=UPI0028AED7E4|nr:hypothetical protein [Soonwooa sp.]